jgi:hypothetical protein
MLAAGTPARIAPHQAAKKKGPGKPGPLQSVDAGGPAGPRRDQNFWL